MSIRKVIIFAGLPGSGKGTIGNLCSQHFKLPHISTGDLIRDEIKSQTLKGKILQPFVTHGIYVPYQLINPILFSRLQNDDCQSGFILDGYPRTISQYYNMKKLFEEMETSISKVLVMDVDEKDCQHRILNRHRMDDNIESINKRFQHYQTYTQELLHHPEIKDKVIRVDAGRDINQVFNETCRVIENL